MTHRTRNSTPEDRHQEHLRYYAKYRNQILERNKLYWKKLRMEVLNHYSNNTMQCNCCKEFRYEFLSIDHVTGGGNQHRQTEGKKILGFLKRNNYPEGYQVLCHNCNQAKGFYGTCPHQREQVVGA